VHTHRGLRYRIDLSSVNTSGDSSLTSSRGRDRGDTITGDKDSDILGSILTPAVGAAAAGEAVEGDNSATITVVGADADADAVTLHQESSPSATSNPVDIPVPVTDLPVTVPDSHR
jgi:hypothetical protein